MSMIVGNLVLQINQKVLKECYIDLSPISKDVLSNLIHDSDSDNLVVICQVQHFLPSRFHSATKVLNLRVFIMVPLDIIWSVVRNDMNRVFCPSHTGTQNCQEFACMWSTFGTDIDEEKTDLKDSNGDATLKQDTKKTGAVGKDLEKTVTNESNGDSSSKEDTNKSGDVGNELQKTVTNEINCEGSLQHDANNKTGAVGNKFEKNCYK